ncbi:MAG TPA: universal stress protein, partial [Rubrivivax sp.]|nr:universal stress protein [Rubrivivax sp.]
MDDSIRGPRSVSTDGRRVTFGTLPACIFEAEQALDCDLVVLGKHASRPLKSCCWAASASMCWPRAAPTCWCPRLASHDLNLRPHIDSHVAGRFRSVLFAAGTLVARQVERTQERRHGCDEYAMRQHIPGSCRPAAFRLWGSAPADRGFAGVNTMKPIRRVLVATDFSAGSDAAVERAVRLAR